jgi:hypothetical protein
MAHHPLIQNLQKLRAQVGAQQQLNQKLAYNVQQREIAHRQGLKNINGPQDVKDNLSQVLPNYLMPGNIGDVNKVCWPFWFTNITPELPAAIGGNASQSKATVTITQEAAFIVTSITKAVFIHTVPAPGVNVYTYVDAEQVGQTPLTPGLSMALIDAQSSRNFMSQPLNLDHIGDAKFPTELPTPLMFLPNSVIETQLFNSNPTNAYIPWITFLGVRCRIEDAQRIYSTITG